ncbi:MAG: Protein UmuC [Chlamydiia bacterium]|nr:Protein UmuC [Chlamydiia bacterium]MCH9618357.1 Protein UmuC [Chlamydiia bacterium]MCH9624221.1 Protein UmuC [Chlamydiia bacterium]
MKYICLIDCDNFFASCEKIFHPEYRGKPLVVAGGKNGIVIARSKEARALGIPMCAAVFNYRSLFIKEDVIIKAPNHIFYQDISNRIRETVATFSFKTFIYSIDEMFLEIPKESYSDKLLEEIQHKIKKWTSIDVSIGISYTKTLAKVATKLAKKIPSHRKALVDEKSIANALLCFPVDDIWGVGRKSAEKLKLHRIKTGKDLLSINEAFLKKLLGISGFRLKKELQGTNAYPFICAAKDKSLQITRTFNTEIVSINSIKEILSSFISKGCEKLREMNKEAECFSLFMESSRFKNKGSSYSKTFTLDEPSNFTPDFLHLKEKGLKDLLDGSLLIKRAGVHFFSLIDSGSTQSNLFTKKPAGNKKLMKTLDSINAKYGSNTLRYASIKNSSPEKGGAPLSYTTNWEQILEINI